MGTHSPLLKKSHTAAHRSKQGCFGWRRHLYPLTVLRAPETLRGQRAERQTLPLLGLGRGCSRRTQRACGAAMRSCASLLRRRRGPAGLRDLFSFLSKLRLVCPALSAFRMCETRGGIITLGVLCVLLKHSAAACQSDSFVVFLRPLFTFAKAPAGHCQYPHRYRLPAAQSPADKPPALD